MVTDELADKIQNAAIPYVMVQTEERNEKVLSNLAVDANEYVDFDVAEIGIREKVFYPVLKGILEECEGDMEAIRAEFDAMEKI